MPIVRRKFGEDEPQPGVRRAGAPGAGAPAATGGGAPQGPQAPGRPAGNFANLQDYLRVNQAGGQQMAGKLLNPAEKQASFASGGQTSQTVMRGGQETQRMGMAGPKAPEPPPEQSGQRLAAADAAEKTAGLGGTYGGRDTLLQQQFGQGGQYSQGERGMDNFLMGATSGGRFQELSQQYKGLSDMVRGQMQARDEATADIERKRKEAEAAAAQRKPGAGDWGGARAADMPEENTQRQRDEQALIEARAAGYRGADPEEARQYYRAKFNEDLP
jgi:hypothetical protein